MRRPTRLTLILPLLLGLAAGAAFADPADRTDEAFGLLLAMPGAQPVEGGWIVPHDPARNESDLVAQWQRLKKAGADVNAMRHGGTLLAHALRAGKERAAIWLLRNGADTRKPLQRDTDTAYDLARRYQRNAVLKVLEQDFGFKPAMPPAAASAVPTSSSSAPPTRVEQARALMRQLVGPVLQPSDEAQRQWRRYAAELSTNEFQAIVEGPAELELLVILTRNQDGGLEEALARLPVERVRANAQGMADVLADSSYVTYADREPRIAYTGSARSWPALWKRIDRPLHYERWPDLAARIPPAQWPALFASGYVPRDAAATGCALAAVDLPGLRALWPDFRRLFADALDEAPGLVLAAYRVSRERSPCTYGSTPADTAAKLAFLRAQGATKPVHGLIPETPTNQREPALAAMIAAFTPPAPTPPRLVAVAPTCQLELADAVLDALARTRLVGWGTPAQSVGIVEIPGRRNCGLIVSGETFPDRSLVVDSFAEGPFRDPPTPNCADSPDDVEIWLNEADGVKRLALDIETRGLGMASLHAVRDVQTGKRYWVDAGMDGPLCAQRNLLPRTYEWKISNGLPQLVHSADDRELERLLRRQCAPTVDDDNVHCPDLELPTPPEQLPVIDQLRQGATVLLPALLESLGRERRAAYAAALAAHDHAKLRSLMARGIPPAWTAAEIASLARSELPLPEKRRRIALLFANAEQLQLALVETGFEAAKSLAWLPRADWGPVLRLIRQSPGDWYEWAYPLREAVPEDVACEIDRAQGFLCGGGLKLD
ncbi:hypothetical protein AACH06_23485 [Ideonella sp. DXS29W]|uniref:Ankyrin repeat domain-containing protein n=1 Tax=Ideonella lacteola TaxID=2984193 RepID=A0ABU9BYB0_9BURK